MIGVTGGTGRLGRLVIEQLLPKIPAGEIIAAVRDPDKARDLTARGVQVRRADYDMPETLVDAFQGVEKLLQSILPADTAGCSLADEHRVTEKAVRDAGVPFAFLRNGWYLENYTENLGPALKHGAFLGAAKAGRIAAAARADFAAAVVTVLTTTGPDGTVYELAGDQSFTMADLAAEVAHQAGKPVIYRDLPAEEYEETLKDMGLPARVAEMIASADDSIARGELDVAAPCIGWIGRSTLPLSQAVAAGLKRG